MKLSKLNLTLRSSYRTNSNRCLRSSCESCCPPSIHCIVFFLNEFNNSDGWYAWRPSELSISTSVLCKTDVKLPQPSNVPSIGG